MLFAMVPASLPCDAVVYVFVGLGDDGCFISALAAKNCRKLYAWLVFLVGQLQQWWLISGS